MSKTFTYTKIDTVVYDSKRDKYEEYGYEFEYEVSDDDLLDQVVEFLKEDFSNSDVKQTLKCLIKTLDLLDVFVECYEDSLKDAFEQEALDSYE